MRRANIPVLLLAVALLAPAAAAQTDNWPTRPIRVIVPFGAGSGADIVPRMVFELLAPRLGQPIIVENRGGAGGTIGASVVAKAEADGHTLLATSSAHSIAPAIYPHMSYDVVRDFAAVGVTGTVPVVLVVASSAPFSTVQEFVAAAKASPGTFNFASVGAGSAVHLGSERFRITAGYEAVHIPFKGGAEALTEVIAGRITYYFCPISTALPHIRSAALRALVVSGQRRSADLPDVPTLAEAGFAAANDTFWIGGLFAPAKTSPTIIAKLHGEMMKVTAMPGLREKLAQIGIEPLPLAPAEFDALVKTEVDTFTAFAKAAKLKLD